MISGSLLLVIALAAGLLSALGNPPSGDSFLLGFERFLEASLLPAGLGLLLLADARRGGGGTGLHLGFRWRMTASAVLLLLALISLRHLPGVLDHYDNNSLAARGFLNQIIQPASLAFLILMSAGRVSGERVRGAVAHAGMVCGVLVVAGGLFLAVSGAQLAESAVFWVFLAQGLVPVGLGVLLLVEVSALREGTRYESSALGGLGGYILLSSTVLLGMYIAITIDGYSAAEQLLCDTYAYENSDCATFARVFMFVREAVLPATIALLVLAASRKFLVSRLPGVLIAIVAVPLALWAVLLSDLNLSRILDRGDFKDAGQTAFLLMQNGLSPVESLQAAGLDALADFAGKLVAALLAAFLAALGPTLGFGLLLVMRNRSMPNRAMTVQGGGGPQIRGAGALGPVTRPRSQRASVAIGQASPRTTQAAHRVPRCTQCTTEVEEDARFCHNCGADLTPQPPVPDVPDPLETESLCPQCDIEVPAGAHFCHNCGTDLVLRPREPATAQPQPEAEEPVERANLCAQCTLEVRVGAQFCHNCGTAVA